MSIKVSIKQARKNINKFSQHRVDFKRDGNTSVTHYIEIQGNNSSTIKQIRNRLIKYADITVKNNNEYIGYKVIW